MNTGLFVFVVAVIELVLLCAAIIFVIPNRNRSFIMAGTLHIDESDITDVKMKLDCDLDIDELAKLKTIGFKVNYISPKSQEKQ